MRFPNVDPRSLRGRLIAGYAVALVVALVSFAAVALLVVDRAQRAALDARLLSTANALGIIGDVRRGTLRVDADDRRQFHVVAGRSGGAAIVASDGTIAVTTDAVSAHALRHLAGAGVGTAPTTARVSDSVLRVVTEPIVASGKRAGVAMAWSALDSIEAIDRRVALGFALAIPIVALAALGAGAEIARRGLLPLERMARLASEIEARDLSGRLDFFRREDELGRLGAAFDRMLDRLQSAFERERRFTSDASHELRAPLSVIRAEADLALRAERTPADYRRALETIASEADALETLTRDLLAAARGRNGGAASEPFALIDRVRCVVERMRPLIDACHVTVDDRSGGAAIVVADRALLDRAILGGLHNAIKFAPQGGHVALVVSNDDGPTLRITDDGPGFSTVGLERAFERFWRDDEARSREGNGLGLSIARAIVEGYGGTIAIANVEPHGGSFEIRFPSAAGRRE